MDETSSQTLPITVTVNPPAPPDPKLDGAQLVALARELVQLIKHPAEIFPDYKITQEQFDAHIITNGYFKRAYDALLIEWNAASSTNKRLAMKSAAVLEDSLTKVGARMTNEKETLTAVVEAGKFFAKLAGAGEDVRNQQAGEKFSINITIGGQNIKLDAQRNQEASEGLEIRPLIEGERAAQEIRAIPSPDRK